MAALTRWQPADCPTGQPFRSPPPEGSMSTRQGAQPADESPVSDADERVAEIVEATEAGHGLGGRTLGELGTTGGTNVGAELQDATETGVAGRRTPAGHAYDPGMGGRTARGGLGADLDAAICGHQDEEPALLPEETTGLECPT
jgi:hypothetical protein